MRDQDKETKVFEENVSDAEGSGITGGDGACPGGVHEENCRIEHFRNRQESGNDNCAATAEDSSRCRDNDACDDYMVVYRGMKDCNRAWKQRQEQIRKSHNFPKSCHNSETIDSYIVHVQGDEFPQIIPVK